MKKTYSYIAYRLENSSCCNAENLKIIAVFSSIDRAIDFINENRKNNDDRLHLKKCELNQLVHYHESTAN